MEGLEQPGARGLLGDEFSAKSAAVSADLVGVEEATFDPVSEFTLGETRSLAELWSWRQSSYNDEFDAGRVRGENGPSPARNGS
jgi:hypothetical protein